MTACQRRHFRQSVKASFVALYLLANVAGMMALSQDWSSAEENLASHLCVGHLTLMSNVMPDIHC